MLGSIDAFPRSALESITKIPNHSNNACPIPINLISNAAYSQSEVSHSSRIMPIHKTEPLIPYCLYLYIYKKRHICFKNTTHPSILIGTICFFIPFLINVEIILSLLCSQNLPIVPGKVIASSANTYFIGEIFMFE